MVAAAGATSVLGVSGARSQQITFGALAASAPDVIVVSPCGYRLAGAAELAAALVHTRALPDVPVWAVDADAAFVRPRPRLVDRGGGPPALPPPGIAPPPAAL